MATISEWVKIDEQRVTPSLQQAQENVSRAEGELLLDISSLSRIDASALLALEKLLAFAEQKNVKLVLRGVNIDIYKVLKLCRLSSRLLFVD
jgi:anti-anti-sigma regulatory factor